jgi:hypothetical protein
MQALRNASFLARLVLAWFALFIGVAVASPMVNPVSVDLVCTASGGAKLMIKGDAGDKAAGHSLDCPLCVSGGAPPPIESIAAVYEPALAHVLQSIPAARIAALMAAPLPARGPPAAAIV